jgi:ribosomal-protein-alanine N-acetyltransferase
VTLPRPIETERLVLRQPRASDAQPIFDGWTQDPDVTRYLTWRPHARLTDTERFVDRAVDAWQGHTRAVYAIARKSEDDAPIGLVEARLHSAFAAEIGYVLRRADWGKGYMTEAARALVETLFADPAIWRVSAYCDVENTASAHVLEKIGMQREGMLRHFMIHPNLSAAPRDAYLYARVRQTLAGAAAGASST